MSKYKVKYIISSSEYSPLEREEIIFANSLEEAISEIKEYWHNNYMYCEFISIIKETLHEE